MAWLGFLISVLAQDEIQHIDATGSVYTVTVYTKDAKETESRPVILLLPEKSGSMFSVTVVSTGDDHRFDAESVNTLPPGFREANVYVVAVLPESKSMRIVPKRRRAATGPVDYQGSSSTDKNRTSGSVHCKPGGIVIVPVPASGKPTSFRGRSTPNQDVFQVEWKQADESDNSERRPPLPATEPAKSGNGILWDTLIIRGSYLSFDPPEIQDSFAAGIEVDWTLNPFETRSWEFFAGISYDGAPEVDEQGSINDSRTGTTTKTNRASFHFLRGVTGIDVFPDQIVTLSLRGGAGGLIGAGIEGQRFILETEAVLMVRIVRGVYLATRVSYVFTHAEINLNDSAGDPIKVGNVWMFGVGIAIDW